MVDLPGPIPLRGPATPQRPKAQPSERAVTRPTDSDLGGKTLPKLVSLASELASAPPPVDRSRIAEIRAAISTGTYRLNPESIARSLLGDRR
jgi:flagellar biosynthesis anti-sigma factor FlgM